MISSFAFTSFLGAQELEMGSEVLDGSRTSFCLSVTLDDPPPLACADTEKKERGGKKEKLWFISTYQNLWNTKTTLKMDL